MKLDIEKLKKEKSTKELLEFGILNIDKPSGPTSFSVSEFVCKKLGLRKTSHFGTLDPKVTGVLPIALNRACKLTGFFLGEDKTYVGIMRLHEEIEGGITKLQEIMNKKFLGKIMQKPPVKSRVKRVEREREVMEFIILEQDSENNKDFLFKTKVQGGTYIRKLIDDLGKELGFGAHMLELRRIQAGIFEEPAITLYEFEEAVLEYDNGKGNDKKLREMIIPGEVISEVYDVVFVEKESVDKLLHGSPLFFRYLEEKDKKIKTEKGQIICAFSGDRFIGMYKVETPTDPKKSSNDIFALPQFVLQPFE